MKAVYLIIAIVMLFMFVFVANEIDLGVASALLSTGFIGVFIYCLFMFATEWRQSRRRPDEQAEYRALLKKVMKPSARNRTRRRSRREY